MLGILFFPSLFHFAIPFPQDLLLLSCSISACRLTGLKSCNSGSSDLALRCPKENDASEFVTTTTTSQDDEDGDFLEAKALFS